MTEKIPILWSFRRCPYAMRARLALQSAQKQVELREIRLADKPAAFLDISETKTVPVLVCSDGQIIEESRDIMFWALQNSEDPENWLAPYHENPEKIELFFDQLDGPFKTALDRYKYASRYGQGDKEIEHIKLDNRKKGSEFIAELDSRLCEHPYLSGPDMGIVDFACLPFIRQFRLADMHWFDAQNWPFLHPWLASFLVSDRFLRVMEKYPVWQEGQKAVYF